MARTSSVVFDGSKSIPLNAFPPEAWTILGGDKEPGKVQEYAAAVAFLYRAIEVRANALCAVPWKIESGATVVWASEDEDPPTQLAWAADLPNLLWRSVAAWCFYSEAFWLKERNRVRVRDLRWLDPDSMTPVWDKKQGLVGFERVIGAVKDPLDLDEVVYLWRQGLRETEPYTPPAEAAMQAAGVLYNADVFATGFFERGAIKATLLSMDAATPDDELKRVGAWWKRFFGGVKKSWETQALRGDVKAIPVGEGLESLTNETLTQSKREDIATAMGVPHSLIMANAANYATSQQDEKNFYNLTIIPDCLLFQRQLNKQLFTPLGLRFAFDPQEMAVFQEDETARSAAFATYVNAGLPIELVAEMLGLYLPEGWEYADLHVEPEPTVTGQEEEGQETGRQEELLDQEQEEAARLKRWLKKKPGRDPADFHSTILGEAAKAAIAAQLGAQPSDTGIPFRVAAWEDYP